jgi:hypothetical protein
MERFDDSGESHQVGSNSLNVEAMLRAAFLKTEIAFLQRQPAFVEALAKVKKSGDFEGLCQLAEELLGSHSRTDPVVQQLRDEAKRKQP